MAHKSEPYRYLDRTVTSERVSHPDDIVDGIATITAFFQCRSITTITHLLTFALTDVGTKNDVSDNTGKMFGGLLRIITQLYM